MALATEFNDSQHYGFFMTGTTLTSSTGKYTRVSELTLAALRAQGVFDNMEDGTVPPATDKLWLDKNTDPAVLKEYDATGAAWVPMTFGRLFGRAIVTPMATPTGTPDALVVAQPSPFIPNRMYSLTPIADNTGAVTIQVTGVGTFAATYTDGTALEAQEFKDGNPTILLFTGTRFEVLFKVADVYQARDQAVAAAAALPAISANTMLVDNAAGTARETKTFQQVSEVFSFAAWPTGTLRTLKARATDTYCILDAPGSPDPTGVNASTTSLKAMVAEGVRCEVTKGDFVTEEPLLLKTTGQNFFGAGMGYGYGRPNYSMLDFEPMSRIIAAGTFATRIMTRRKHRASVADPKDDPMSAVLDIEADGVTISDIAIWLNTDWADVTPSNYGDDVDVGIFVGCRPGVKMRNVGVFGHFRKAGLYLDVTRALELPELTDWDGNPLPAGASGESFSGGDGTVLDDLFIYGALGPGLAVLGAKHPGGSYYDEATGLVSDMRGASGFSDFRVRGGRFYSTQHQSGRRTRNPTGYGVALTRSNMEAEEDFFPACVYIDGWASNSGSTTHGVGALRNMSFLGARFSGCEAFRVRLGQCDQVKFLDTTWIETGDSPSGTSLWKDTSGVDINVSDYTNNTYGHIATHQTNTGVVWAQDVVGGLNQTWVYSKQRLRSSDAYGREMMQGNWVRADTSTALPTGMAAMRHAYDDGLASEYGGDVIESFRPFQYLKDRSSGNAMGWRYDSGVYQLRQGAHSAGSAPANTLKTIKDSGAEYSGEVTIADDAVASITPPSTGGWMFVTLGPDTTGPQRGRSGLVFYDVGSTLDIAPFANGANFLTSTSDVTGTTGVDGNVTVAVQAGVIKIENRAGGSAVFRYTFIG